MILYLREINISNRVAKIEKNTFFGCENLERIYIPNSVTEFDSEIFTDCDKLTIYCHKGSAAEKYAIANQIEIYGRSSETTYKDDSSKL